MCLEWEKSLLETYNDTETVSSDVASSIIVAYQLDKPGEHFGVYFKSKHTRSEASVVSLSIRRLAQLTTRMVTTDVTSRLLKSMGVASVSNPFRIRISMATPICIPCPQHKPLQTQFKWNGQYKQSRSC